MIYTGACPKRGSYVIDIHRDPSVAYFGTVVTVKSPLDRTRPTRLEVQIVNLNNELHWVDHTDVGILDDQEFKDLCIEVEGTDRALKRALVWPNPFLPAKKSPWSMPDDVFDMSSWISPGEAVLTPEGVRESKGYSIKDLEEMRDKTWTERVHVPVKDTTFTFRRWLPGDPHPEPDKVAEIASKTSDRVSLAIPRKRAQKHLTVRRRTLKPTTERRR